MIGVSWNCQGLGNPSTVQELERIVNQKKPNFVFIMETKLLKKEVDSILHKLDFDFVHAVDCDMSQGGRRGGICLLWKDGFNFGVNSDSLHHIDATTKPKHGEAEWRITGIYGWVVENDKNQTWALLRSLNHSSDFPWLCFGDWNEILYSHEKVGGISCSREKMADFLSALDFCGLDDLGYLGHQFTWTNGQSGAANIQERLDRGVGNQIWMNLFPSVSVQHLVRVHSDHCPIVIADCRHPTLRERQKRAFRFEAMWLQNPNCKDVVDEAWSHQQQCSSPTEFALKVKNVGRSLRTWESLEFGHVGKQINNLHHTIEALQGKEATLCNITLIRDTDNELKSLLQKDETMWKQRSRVNWLADGDKNTSFYHRTASGRRRRNRIEGIEDSDGKWQTNESEVVALFIDYFKDIFHSEECQRLYEVLTAIPPKVSPTMNDMLDATCTDEEVVNALKQMHPLKAPGPDALPALFYVKFWSAVKTDLLNTVLNILNNGASPQCLNHTNLALIPKTKTPTLPLHFRPISLCNVVVKIVTKCIANRLKPILPNLISQAQSAFVPGRLITDNALLAFELFSYHENKLL